MMSDSRRQRKQRARARQRRKIRFRPMSCEKLEDRRLLATVYWDGEAGDFNWHSPLNWDSDALPGPTDDVTIDVAEEVTIVHQAGTTEINSLTSTNKLAIRGGILDVATNVQVDNNFTLDGGALKDATVLPGAPLVVTSADGTLDGVTLGVDTTLLGGAQVTVRNDLTLANNIRLRLERTSDRYWENWRDVGLNFSGGTQTLGGTGEVELFSAIVSHHEENDVRVRPTGGGSLTIGPGITVRNASNSRFVTLGDPSQALTIEGTVSAESSGRTLRVTGSTVTTTTTSALQAQAGELDVNNLTGNLNEATIVAADLDLAGTYAINQPLDVPGGSLTLRGDWTNASTITQSAGTIHLGNAFTVEDLGAHVPTNFSGTGGTVNIFGTLSAEVNPTLLINSERTWQLNGGTIEGVTIADDDDGDPVASFRVTSADGTLDGVTLGVDTTLLGGAQVTVLNDLILDDSKLRLQRTDSFYYYTHPDVGLNFSGGDQTLGGTGEVELYSSVTSNHQERHVRVRPTGGGSLTIGPDITVRNAANSRFVTLGDPSQALTIEGTVSAESSGRTLRVTGSTVNNTGHTLTASAGSVLEVRNLAAHNGRIFADVGGTVNVVGNFVQEAGGTVAIGMQGTNSGDFGKINVSDAATLGGVLEVVRVNIFQAVGFFRLESGPTQAVLPLVGLGGGESHP
ncbi:MAG: hypothetical protein ACQESR_03205 [Planctomycetota bacterium]